MFGKGLDGLLSPPANHTPGERGMFGLPCLETGYPYVQSLQRLTPMTQRDGGNREGRYGGCWLNMGRGRIIGGGDFEEPEVVNHL